MFYLDLAFGLECSGAVVVYQQLLGARPICRKLASLPLATPSCVDVAEPSDLVNLCVSLAPLSKRASALANCCSRAQMQKSRLPRQHRRLSRNSTCRNPRNHSSVSCCLSSFAEQSGGGGLGTASPTVYSAPRARAAVAESPGQQRIQDGGVALSSCGKFYIRQMAGADVQVVVNIQSNSFIQPWPVLSELHASLFRVRSQACARQCKACRWASEGARAR